MSTGETDGFEIDPHEFLADDDAPAVGSAATGIASLGRIEQELTDVERALTDLDEGRYGVCTTCGTVISDAHLAEHPATGSCAEHAVAP